MKHLYQYGKVGYVLSTLKCRAIRRIKNIPQHFALTKQDEPFEFKIYTHKSLIRRRLGNVNMQLQENKAVNLSLAAPHINHVIIRPGEIFSFWELVGKPSAKKGYLEGLTIGNTDVGSGIGGGMCQFTNLIHWLILHSELDIVEHHHHDGLDLFPDFGRVIPFGTGTSILYNYLDYRFQNNTNRTYQLIVYTTEEYLCGELRASSPQEYSFHIHAENECFVREGDDVYRCGDVIRDTIDVHTGRIISYQLIRKNHAKVCYDTSNLNIVGESPIHAETINV